MIYSPGETVYNNQAKKFGRIQGLINLDPDSGYEFYIVSVGEGNYVTWCSLHLHGLNEWFLISPNYPNYFGKYNPYKEGFPTCQIPGDSIWVNREGHILVVPKNFDITKVHFITTTETKPRSKDMDDKELDTFANQYRVCLDCGGYDKEKGNPKI